MGRKASWPPVPHPHKGSGQDRLRWRGEEWYLGPTGSDQARAEYNRVLRELIDRGADGGAAGQAPTVGPRATVAQVALLWRNHALEKYGADNAELTSHDLALRALVGRFAALAAADFDADRLDEVRETMITAGLCANVINRRIGRIKTAWRWLERKKLVPKGSWGNLRALGPLDLSDRRVRKTAPVKAAEWAVVAAVCRRAGGSVRGLLLSQWFTAARPGELFGLTPAMLVKEKDGTWSYRPEKHKNAWRGHARLIVFGPRAQAVLRPLLVGKGPDELIFPNRFSKESGRDRRHNRRSYYLATARAAAEAGVELHPYQIRHSAKKRTQQALGREHAQHLLGHASPETTDRYAAGADEALAREAARRLG